MEWQLCIDVVLKSLPSTYVFGRSRNAWEAMDQTKYATFLDDPVAAALLEPVCEGVGNDPTKR